MQIRNQVYMPSRTGRQNQRYNQGCRQVVGCIPYRYTRTNEEIEVLMISSQKNTRMMFPKGGWELDESIEAAAKRETLEEAGVSGIIGAQLGTWKFESRSQGTTNEGHMFPLLVSDESDDWAEQNFRKRVWVKVNKARDECVHFWMKQALDPLMDRLEHPPRKEEEHRSNALIGLRHFPIREDELRTSCSVEYRRTEEPRIASATAEEDVRLLPC